MAWRVERWGPSELRTYASQVLGVYRAAFLETHEEDPVRATADRGVSLLEALHRPALRAVGAFEPATEPGSRDRGFDPGNRDRGFDPGSPDRGLDPGSPDGVSDPEPSRLETIVGFGYGYTSLPGQWWHDVVHRALATTGAQGWLDDCFAVVELHVLPGRQGRGLGRALLATLLDGVPHATVALSAIDDPGSRAMRLYADMGFTPLISRFRFPGNSPAYAVLARSSP